MLFRIQLSIYFFILPSFCSYATPDTIYLFSHGIADSQKQALHYIESKNPAKPYIIKGPVVSFNYPDAYEGLIKINRLQTSLAQDNEVLALARTYFAKAKDALKTILVGVSRGASAIINFIALYYTQNVSALVLESPFDCIENVIHELIHTTKLGWIPGMKKNSLSIASLVFCKYKPNGIRPIDLCTHIHKDLPILIICSQEDRLVPFWSSLNIYCALRESGHTNTYILILPHGRHAQLIHHPTQGNIYQQVVHAFYKKFNLPHDPILAQQGELLFSKCQPEIEQVRELYPSHTTPNTKDIHVKR